MRFLEPITRCGMLLVVALAVGCQAAAVPSSSAAPDVTVGSVTELDQWVASARGQVVLVDYWATWCTPCTENFPHIVALADAHRDQGLTAISVSLDSADEVSKVKRFLQTVKAHKMKHLLSKDGGGTRSMEAFGLEEAVPHYRLYDRAGALRFQWNHEAPDLDEKLALLLAEKE